MIAEANVVDQEFAGHITADLRIIPPTLFGPKVAQEGVRAALVQDLLALNFLLVLGVCLEKPCIEADPYDIEIK